MNAEQLSDRIGQIDSALIPTEQHRRPRRTVRRLISIAACVAILIGAGTAVLRKQQTANAVQTLAQATYPAMAGYPDLEHWDSDAYDAWQKDLAARRNLTNGLSKKMDGFYATLLPQLLNGENGKNRVCSPLSIYMALSLLAECTAGDTQSELLTRLGVSDIDALRRQANALWNADYRDDGAAICRMANALFLQNGVPYQKKTLQTLAENYYADTFSGKTGTPEYDRCLQNWVNEHTGQLLTDNVAGLTMPADAVMTLVNTLLLKVRWAEEFSEENNRRLPFHAVSGDTECTYLWREFCDTLYTGNNYRAVQLPLDGNDKRMWLILPDEGASPADILRNGQWLSMLETGPIYPATDNDKSYCTIELSVPKFDVSAECDIINALQQIGIQKVFDVQQADFSALINGAALAVDRIDHAARVAIDEEGVTAAAYTVEQLDGAGEFQLQRVKMTFDRPFLFAITGADNAILFAGVIEQP